MPVTISLLLFMYCVRPVYSGQPKLAIGPAPSMLPGVQCTLKTTMDYILGEVKMDMHVYGESEEGVHAWSRWKITDVGHGIIPKIEILEKNFEGKLHCTSCLDPSLSVSYDQTSISMNVLSISLDPMHVQVFCAMDMSTANTSKLKQNQTQQIELDGVMCMLNDSPLFFNFSFCITLHEAT